MRGECGGFGVERQGTEDGGWVNLGRHFGEGDEWYEYEVVMGKK